MGDLENMLNATRQEAKEETRQHLTELWSAAANLTQKELQRVWMTINATQIGLEEVVMKVKVNLSKQVISMVYYSFASIPSFLYEPQK